MEGQSGLSELSVISWVSAIQGCPLSGVPLYSIHYLQYTYSIHYLHASIKVHYCEFEMLKFSCTLSNIMHVHTLYKVNYINTQYILYIFIQHFKINPTSYTGSVVVRLEKSRCNNGNFQQTNVTFHIHVYIHLFINIHSN